MIFQSGVITAGSGSFGGMTLSRNKGGMYMRARAVPTNPGTPAQGIVRTAMALLSNRWANTLTQVQRDGWDTYSEQVELTNPLGDPRNVGGIGMYNRTNVPGIRAGFPVKDDAPIIFDVGGFSPLTLPTATDAGDLLGATFDPTDDWAVEDGAAMLIWGARPANVGIKYFKGPYQFVGILPGSSGGAPASPFSVANVFPFAVGQRVFFRVTIMRADGRYSGTQRLTALAA